MSCSFGELSFGTTCAAFLKVFRRTLYLLTSFQKGKHLSHYVAVIPMTLVPLLNTDLWLPYVPLFLFVHSAFFSSSSSPQFSYSGFLQFLSVACLPTWLFPGEGWLVISGSCLFYKFYMFMCRHFRSALNHPTFSRVRQLPHCTLGASP